MASAQELLRSWDDQQAAYIKHRDQRFTVMAETIARLCGPTPRILDLACGPGSTTRGLLATIPDARVLAVDKDPVLLAIAREVFSDISNVAVRDHDLDHPEWLDDIDYKFDAVVSSTALHWLRPEALSRLYFTLAGKIRDGGVFLNADHLLYDAVAQQKLRGLARQDDEANKAEAYSAGADSWEGWWQKVESLPEYATETSMRRLLWQDKIINFEVSLGFHLETLRSAGFSEVGTIWQYLDDYVVCAVR